LGKRTTTGKPTAGPSLLSQQAPSTNSVVESASPSIHHRVADAASLPDAKQGAEESFEHVRVIIADFGNATWSNHHFTEDIQTRQYRSPEVMLGAPWGPSADTWSAACVIFELLTGGDYLFDPASASRYSKDDDHLAQIIELLGDMPKSLARDAKYSKEFFDDNGKLKRITKLRRWPVDSVLTEKYLTPPDQAQLIASFLNPMLHLEPLKRMPPSRLRNHPWLRGVTLPS